MSLRKILIQDLLGNLLGTLPVAPESGKSFFIKDLSGAGPVKADISTVGIGSTDGVLFRGAKVGARNLVITLGISSLPLGMDVSDVREGLLRHMEVKRELEFVFHRHLNPTPDNTYKIRGYVEDFNYDMFSSVTDIQVSILCPDPYYESFKKKVISSTTGQIIDSSGMGSGPSGFIFDMTAAKAMPSLIIETDPYVYLRYDYPILAGDRILISTVRGDRYVRLARSGKTSSQLDAITQGTLALSASSRSPIFRARVSALDTEVSNPYTITYTPKYTSI